jgi:ankyrin repeat protein
MLLKYGALINIKDCNGSTPIHFGTLKLPTNDFKDLCNHGANINSETNWGDTPLHLALKNNAPEEKVQFLLDYPLIDLTIKNKLGESCLTITQKSNAHYEALVRLALNDKLLDSFEGHLFIENHNLCEVVTKLIKTGANVNTRDSVSLQYCGRNALHRSIDNRCKQCFLTLINAGAKLTDSPNSNYETTYIHAALESEFYEIIEVLLNNKIDLNIKNGNGNTPLRYALLNDLYTGVKTLIDCGALISTELFKLPGTQDKQIIELLTNTYEAQECCICMENQKVRPLSYIPCKNKHWTSFLCKYCHNNLLRVVNKKKQCPFDCGDLSEYEYHIW